MIRITEVQRRVLAMMLKYDCPVYAHSGRGYHSAFFGDPCPQSEWKAVRPRTVYTLRDKELIRNITPKDRRWSGSRYILTESGRAAVSQGDDADER